MIQRLGIGLMPGLEASAQALEAPEVALAQNRDARLEEQRGRHADPFLEAPR